MLGNVSAAARLRCNLGNEPVSRAHEETFLSRTAKTVRGPAMAHTITRRITSWLLIVLGAYWMTWGLWHLQDAPVDSGPSYRSIVSQQLSAISAGAGCILLGAYFLAGIKNRD
jgi:hypothetical protein